MRDGKWSDIPQSQMDWESKVHEVLVCLTLWIDDILEKACSDGDVLLVTEETIRIDIADMLMRPGSLAIMENGHD